MLICHLSLLVGYAAHNRPPCESIANLVPNKLFVHLCVVGFFSTGGPWVKTQGVHGNIVLLYNYDVCHCLQDTVSKVDLLVSENRPCAIKICFVPAS